MKFVPKDEKFYDLFEELACKIEEGGKLFVEILSDYQHGEPKLAKLKKGFAERLRGAGGR